MATYNPPKKNTEYIFYVALRDQSNTKLFKAAPTLATGDAKVSIDGGALANLTTLPTVTPAAGKMVKVTLSASEMNGDNITIVFSDAAGAEWCDLVVNLQTASKQFDDLNTTTPPTAAAIADAVWEEAIADHSGTVGSTAEALDAAGGGLTAGAIADAVWDEALAGHLAAGSTGEALNAAGASGDPWTTTLPGAYTGSQAGKILADVLVDTADIQPKLGTITDLGSGATIGANLVDIEAQTDDIGTAGAGLTAIPWNAAWDAEVQSEVQDAIEANHLDHLLAATYDPASKPGAADALLNEMVENDAGVSRFTANALEQAPTGGSAPTASAIADAVWDEARGDHVVEGSFGQSFAAVVNGQAATGTLSTTQATTNLTETTDNHYNDRVVVWVSGVLTGQACQITDYNGTTKLLTYTTLTEAPSNGDKFVIV